MLRFILGSLLRLCVRKTLRKEKTHTVLGGEFRRRLTEPWYSSRWESNFCWWRLRLGHFPFFGPDVTVVPQWPSRGRTLVDGHYKVAVFGYLRKIPSSVKLPKRWRTSPFVEFVVSFIGLRERVYNFWHYYLELSFIIPHPSFTHSATLHVSGVTISRLVLPFWEGRGTTTGSKKGSRVPSQLSG